MNSSWILQNARLFRGAIGGREESPLVDVTIDSGVIVTVAPAGERRGEAETLDLEGRWLLPAFADCHLHLHTLAQQRSVVALDRSIAPNAFAERLQSARTEGMGFSSDDWVVASGWQDPLAADLPGTPREFLDRVSRAPLWAFAGDYHRALLNSAALELCGIDPRGHAGVLLEDAMMDAWASVPELPADLDGAVAALHQFGITAVTSFDGTEARSVWQRAIVEEGRSLRVRHSMPREEFLEQAEANTLPPVDPDREAHFLVPWVKGFLDGTLGSRTAWLLEPYSDAPDSFGDERVSASERRRLVETIAPTDYALSLHAIGDAAVRAAIEMIDAAREERIRLGKPGLAHDRIEHTQLLDRASLGRLRRSGAIASLQPCHLLEDAAIGPERFGERTIDLFAARTLLDAKVPVIFGSDAPIETADPWVDIRAAVDRIDRAKRFPAGWIPEERISVEEAIHGRTAGCAEANRLPIGWGKIEAGSPADLQVLECADPRTVGTTEEAQLLELFFAGVPTLGGFS